MSTAPRFAAPGTVDEAVDLLREEGALALSGGTSLALLLGQGLIEPNALVWLGRIPELRRVTDAGDHLRIGATVTLREVARHPAVRSALPALARAAGHVGNPRIRAVATVGGALAHADPRQDLPPALVALDATLVTRGPTGFRTLPIGDLATGWMETALHAGELITEVRVPIVAETRSVYLRYTPGSAADYPTVGAAAAVTRGEDRAVAAARLALAGVGPTVVDVLEAASLAGHGDPPPEAIAAVASAAASRAHPVGDRLGTAGYKRAMAAVWARRALAACLDRQAPVL
ncbi:MAG: FAD binding domain-containing protein [Acidimicrobiales bacterium]